MGDGPFRPFLFHDGGFVRSGGRGGADRCFWRVVQEPLAEGGYPHRKVLGDLVIGVKPLLRGAYVYIRGVPIRHLGQQAFRRVGAAQMEDQVRLRCIVLEEVLHVLDQARRCRWAVKSRGDVRIDRPAG